MTFPSTADRKAAATASAFRAKRAAGRGGISILRMPRSLTFWDGLMKRETAWPYKAMPRSTNTILLSDAPAC